MALHRRDPCARGPLLGAVTVLIRLNTYNLDAAERAVILEALRHVESIVDAGRVLGVSRHVLRNKFRKHKINPHEHLKRTT